MNDDELTARVERAEVAVWRDMVRAATPEVAERLGLRDEPIAGGMALVASGYPHILYNRVFGIGLDAPVDERAIDRAIGLYRRDAPFSIQPSPAARPNELRAWLAARGLVTYVHWVRWVCEARTPIAAPTTLRIEHVHPDQAATFADLICTVFEERPLESWVKLTIGRPRWTQYLAWDGEAPVAGALLHLQGDIGWLGWGGTLPSHRGRGAQSALIAARVRDAAAGGARWVTSETAEDTPQKPNASFRNMERAGFRLLYRRPSFAHVPPKTTRTG